MEKERIRYVPVDRAWLCTCGNTVWRAGFYPCTKEGIEIPDWNSKFHCCGECGRIINPDTLEVIGMAGDNLAAA